MKSFSIRQIPQLESIIAEHNSLYMTTFKTNLKPKHHFLIHYPSCILKRGPISLNWSMRFKSKHCLLKLISIVTKSRVNLCKTIMTRYSYIFAHDLYSCVVFSRRLISDIGPQQGIEGCYRWIVWQGVKFQLRDFVSTGCTEETVPEFVVIDQIMQLCENTVILKVHSLLTLGRDQHFSSYIVCKPLELIEREVNIAL